MNRNLVMNKSKQVIRLIPIIIPNNLPLMYTKNMVHSGLNDLGKSYTAIKHLKPEEEYT